MLMWFRSMYALRSLSVRITMAQRGFHRLNRAAMCIQRFIRRMIIKRSVKMMRSNMYRFRDLLLRWRRRRLTKARTAALLSMAQCDVLTVRVISVAWGIDREWLMCCSCCCCSSSWMPECAVVCLVFQAADQLVDFLKASLSCGRFKSVVVKYSKSGVRP